uniref:Uncharacterized protein n=1 Tax=Arundo donax TaxID=35708 RepID=A0A0A8Z8Q6_ARUDO
MGRTCQLPKLCQNSFSLRSCQCGAPIAASTRKMWIQHSTSSRLYEQTCSLLLSDLSDVPPTPHTAP